MKEFDGATRAIDLLREQKDVHGKTCQQEDDEQDGVAHDKMKPRSSLKSIDVLGQACRRSLWWSVRHVDPRCQCASTLDGPMPGRNSVLRLHCARHHAAADASCLYGLNTQHDPWRASSLA